MDCLTKKNICNYFYWKMNLKKSYTVHIWAIINILGDNCKKSKNNSFLNFNQLTTFKARLGLTNSYEI